jgi:hypothetical protein
VLDPRFNFLFDAAAASTAASASVAAAMNNPGVSDGAGSSSNDTAAVGNSEGQSANLAPVPPLAVDVLLGAQPILGRPPFLGPRVRKLTATQHVLGGLDWSCSSSRPVQQLRTGLRVLTGPWDDARWGQLLTLLADHPPRDLQPEGVQFLRGLPMFLLVKQPQGLLQQQQGGLQDSMQQPGASSSSSSGVEGGPAAPEAAPASQIVALGSSTDWVLAPAAVLQACAGVYAG